MDFLYEKPKSVGATLPAKLIIEVVGPDNPTFKFFRRTDPDCPPVECPEVLDIVKTEGCFYSVVLPESLHKYGAGVYDVKAFDGCDECGSFPIRFDHECKVSCTEVIGSDPAACEVCC